MSLPPILTHHIELARLALQNNTNRDLPAQHHTAVLQIFHSQGLVGHHARVWLDIFVARRVLPFWERVWPNDTEPASLLLLAEGFLMGVVQREDAYAGYSHAVDASLLSNFGQPGMLSQSWCAFDLAKQALYEALNDDFELDMAYRPLRDETGDNSIAPLAAFLESGGAWNMLDPYIDMGLVLGPATDLAQRGATFCEWWLTDAIPEAWNAARGSTMKGREG